MFTVMWNFVLAKRCFPSQGGVVRLTGTQEGGDGFLNHSFLLPHNSQKTRGRKPTSWFPIYNWFYVGKKKGQAKKKKRKKKAVTCKHFEVSVFWRAPLLTHIGATPPLHFAPCHLTEGWRPIHKATPPSTRPRPYRWYATSTLDPHPPLFLDYISIEETTI